MKMKTFRGPHMFDHQWAVIQGLRAHPFNSIHTVKSKRQCGKSILAEMIILEAAINHPGSCSIILSPTIPQSRKIFGELKNIIEGTSICLRTNESILEIYLSNNSSILLKSAAQRESLRGYTIKKGGILCIDEGAYIATDIFASVLQWTNAYKANTLILSSPRYASGFFYDCYVKGYNHSPGFYSYDFGDYDTSMLLSDERIEMYRKLLPKNQFKTEVLGEFLDNDSVVFGDFSSCLIKNASHKNNCVFGIDWGSGADGDYTAISILNDSFEQVEIVYFNDLDSMQTIDKIVELVKKYNPTKITVEKNSIGAIFYDLLRKAIYDNHLHTTVTPFNTSNASKTRLVNQLQVYIQNNQIKLLDNVELKMELNYFQAEVTKTNLVTFNAAPGFHDDLIMATMLSLNAMKAGNYCIH